MKILGKLSCWALGHKRGRRVKFTIEGIPGVKVSDQVECPRCAAQWTRKTKVKP